MKRKGENVKLARLCWNSNGWVKPSGRVGKSKSEKSYEGENGFGHEEWLFDHDKLIDGYQYGFLQPIGGSYAKYSDHKFNIYFYTIDGETKEYYWVGSISDVEVINPDKATEILNIYKKEGWFQQMIDDLRIYDDLIVKQFLTDKKPWQYFNVRFKPQEAVVNEYLVSIKDHASIIKSTRYKLMNFDPGSIRIALKGQDSGYDFKSGSLDSSGLKKKSKKTQKFRMIELELNHNNIMRSFLSYLQMKYPNDESRRECNAYGRNQIDIVRRTKNGDIFYEIKTYNHLSYSIRVAIGQLMEYSFFPDVENAIGLIIVSDIAPDNNIRKYIAHLNKFLKIPLSYIYFDCTENIIIEEIHS